VTTPSDEGGGPFVAVIFGLVAGTLLRATRWFQDGKFQRTVMIRDISSLGVLGLVSVVICKAANLQGEEAALVGAGVAVLGVDAVRKYAVEILDDFIRRWAKSRGDSIGKKDDPA